MPQDRAHRPDAKGGGPPAEGGDPSKGPHGANADARGAGTYFLGRYRVVDEIGVGGMASVHLGRMDGPGGFQKWVAIKRIHSHLVEDDTFIHMFLDEARVAARISHPNVATVFELGKHEDTYWIAMEYLHGEPLREVMRRTEEIGQPMPPEIACRVIADAAEGLHAAHELLGKNGEKLQLVHRDVTPHNLFVTYDGTTKVVDFGIAKFSSRMSNTRAGTLKGKLAYMSPEQVHGEGIDRRTDIFALGVVLWELTTGQRLFRMESDLDTLAKVQECNVPRPSSVIRGYPIDLEKIVMKALSKNRGERFKTAREFSRALQSLLMRRGLFIASDEVASYVQSIFQDRIKKREAHLRWAADVTQTINLDGMLAPAPVPVPPAAEGSVVTYNSEVQPSKADVARGIRPAAGMPAATPGAAERNPSARPGAAGMSQTTNPRPGARNVDTMRPPPKGAAVMTRRSAPAPPPSEHPALDEGPTLQASPQARSALVSSALEVEGDEDFDDNDDTIVTTTRIDSFMALQGPAPAAGKPASFPAPAPRGSSRENQSFAAPPRSVPPRAPAPAPLPPVLVTSTGQMPSLDGRNTAHVDALLAEALAETRGQAPPTATGSQPLGEPPGARPMSEAIDDALRLPPRMSMQPTQPRLFAPPLPSDMRTETARTVRRPPPMWMVALGSGLAALVIAAIVIAVASRTSNRAPPPSPTALATATMTATPPAQAPAPALTAAAASSASDVSASAAPSLSASAAAGRPIGGPFAAARAAFVASLRAASIAAPGAPPGPAPGAPVAAAPPPVSSPPASTVAPSPPSGPVPSAEPVAPAAPVAQPAARAPAAPARRAGVPSAPPSTASTDKGSLTVICFPACEQVIDNGAALGPSPIFKRPVGVGEHRLKLVTSNPPVTKMVSVVVTADETKTVRQPMTP